ncbi:MAG: hypothetical protein AAGG07_13230 [Planctomycetota bacterium]
MSGRLLSPAIALVFAAPALASQPRFFATGSYVFGEPRLFEIDMATGQLLSDARTTGIVDGLGDVELKGIEFAPDGTLYGFSHVPTSRLWRIDQDSAVGEAVGPEFISQVFEGGIAPVDNTTAFITTGNTAADGFLMSVDLQTGVETTLSPLSRRADISGLAYRGDGMLVGLDARGLELPEQLVTIDPETGQIAELAPLVSRNEGFVAGMSVLYGEGYFLYSGLSPSFNPELWRFDLYTGEQEFITTVDANVGFTGLAIQVPGPGSPLLLGVASIAALRRRR